MPFLSFLGLGGSKRASQKANESAALQRGDINSAFDEAVSLLEPLAAQGGLAQELYLNLIGVNGPQAQAQAFQDYIQSPETQFLQQQGREGVERSAASRGGLFSGRTLADLDQRSQQISSLGLNNRLSQLASAGSQGINATNNLANLATGRGSALAGIESNRGRASQQAVLGAQNERVGLTSGLASLGSFGLGGGFDKALSSLSGGAPTDFRRVF